MKRAEKHLQELHFGIEYAVRILRRDGITLTNLEYPKYNELREIRDFDTELEYIEKLIGDFPKYQRGEKIMETLLSKKAFGVTKADEGFTGIIPGSEVASANNPCKE